ncbi:MULTISPECIES: hypothetical protein [Inquilinus]|uniref:Uncharacterized protein n=1 Tax=Inquilinus ginsengisoli TaxID=363840 RepID=A0ABU1JN07_9PROT|nr:hypothetical protein [Inquilinus ginsengisoli]MDR6289993.1 hypothetical protein [Inquilinus ginsengisoli]
MLNFLRYRGACTVLRVATLSAAVAFAAPAIAATPQQCDTLRTLLKTLENSQRTAADQSGAIMTQPVRLEATIALLKLKYPSIDPADLVAMRDVANRVSTSSNLLLKDFDATMKVLYDGLALFNDLCH